MACSQLIFVSYEVAISYQEFFSLFRTPEQCPSVVSLLSESYNPHVRFGAAMALGIACAGTGLKVGTPFYLQIFFFK